MPHLTLDDENGEFALRQLDDDGDELHRLIITEDDVMRLCQSSQSLTAMILARQSRPGASAAALTPVAQLELNTDIHKTEIHLTMIDRNGVRAGYSLPVDVVRPLAERLPVRLAEVEAASKARTRQ